MTIVFGIIRSKAIALMLGPDGMGLIGLYSSIIDFSHTALGLGLQSSGVRQIAEAKGSGDSERLATTIRIIQRLTLVLGLLSILIFVLFSHRITELTFGAGGTLGVALIGFAIGLRIISGGQSAVVQGTRRISDLARINIFAGASSTIICIPLIWWLGELGIAPALVGMALTTLAASWWYSRKLGLYTHSVPWTEVIKRSPPLVSLGLAFMASGLLTAGCAYAVRVILIRQFGVDAAGLYQAAWAIGGVYVGFILQAMGADFYPRLTAAAENNLECNRLVNEQAQVGLLLAAPGVIATLTLAPIVMTLFYSAEFHPAVGMLRWICLGMMLRILAWPMGFIVLAKGAQVVFFVTELAATAVHILAVCLLVQILGVEGAGSAFFVLYLWHAILIYFVVRRLSGFRWCSRTVKVGLVFLLFIGCAFAAFYFLSEQVATVVGLTLTGASSVYAVRWLSILAGQNSLFFKLNRLLFGWWPRRGIA